MTICFIAGLSFRLLDLLFVRSYLCTGRELSLLCAVLMDALSTGAHISRTIEQLSNLLLGRSPGTSIRITVLSLVLALIPLTGGSESLILAMGAVATMARLHVQHQGGQWVTSPSATVVRWYSRLCGISDGIDAATGCIGFGMYVGCERC